MKSTRNEIQVLGSLVVRVMSDHDDPQEAMKLFEAMVVSVFVGMRNIDKETPEEKVRDDWQTFILNMTRYLKIIRTAKDSPL